MKKKLVIAVMAAALAVSQGVTTFAAGSISTDADVDSDYDAGKRNDEVWGNSGTGTNTGMNTGTGGVQVGGTTDSTGSTGSSSVQVGLATGDAATAGLPGTVVTSIQAINAGTSLSAAINDPSMADYKTLTATQAVVTTSAATKEVVTGTTEISIFVPNLTSTLSNVQILFYENATGRWSLITPTSIDAAAKTIRVNINGSGTFAVVYK